MTLLFLIAISPSVALGQDDPAGRWIDRFSVQQTVSAPTCIRAGEIGKLPTFTVTPAATGKQLVRTSIGFAPASFPHELTLQIVEDDAVIAPDVHVLTLHPGSPASVRRAIVTFPFEFANLAPHTFQLSLAQREPVPIPSVERGRNDWSINISGNSIVLSESGITWTRPDGAEVTAELIAPALTNSSRRKLSVVEFGNHYKWVRAAFPDAQYPRIIEVRADSLGGVIVRAHLQRMEKGDGVAPDFGWKISGTSASAVERYAFASATETFRIPCPGMEVFFPDAHLLKRGHVESAASGALTYMRCTQDEKVPMQETAWRTATIALIPSGAAPINSLLEPSHKVTFGPSPPSQIDLSQWPDLDELREYHRNAIANAALLGDDYGNVTSFTHNAPASYYGMNRLNHCPAIFDEYYRSGDARLRETAVQWCSNMYDQSLWWGDTPDFGGTRYNAAVAAGEKAHEGDTSFLWRTNWTSHFCTKGFDAFFLAYEETGDPGFLTALNAQVEYAKKFIFVNTGECRNIGDVADFMRLYQYTGLAEYREEALRLFRELRTKLGDDNLFSQGGQPIIKDGPFIDDDQHGYEAPFAKPYIIGYALTGLPDLLEVAPDEPRLRDTIRAVADFLAESLDPLGGWRYPHPNSSSMILSQALEHAAQIANAARVLEQRGESIENLLDAIETVLQQRIIGYQRTGTMLSGLTGWEVSTGALTDGKTIYDLYQKPADRDRSRDYTEGNVGIGSAPPDGLVYFDEVLAFYLAHRPAERLFHANEKLAQVLARAPDARLKLTPQDSGSFLRVEHPSDPTIGFTLWGPEWVSVPSLGYAQEELGGMKLDWKRDEQTGAVSYAIDRPEATFTAEFIPHIDYVECLYTAWPKPDAQITSSLAVGPCQQMKSGIFEGDDADLMSRMYFLSNGKWTTLASCANDNARNIQYVAGNASPETTGAMAESGWKTIQTPRPDVPLIACLSKDGAWIAATAAENGASICNNANASHRCMHSHGSVPMRRDGPSTLRVNAYLIKSSLDDLAQRHERDAERWKRVPAAPGPLFAQTATYGLRDMLPAFNDSRVRDMQFPGAWRHSTLPFNDWRSQARNTYLKSLGPRPPLAPFNMTLIAEEDRGAYTARKVAFNVSADERVKAYLLVPKGDGPFPAIVALHDHGAHFSIGKEKVIRPFGENLEQLADATDWINKYYGGRFIGDALAQRGYVVFATDALFWGDRGRFGGVEYEDQQAIGANMLQLGLSWAGKIVWDDFRSAEFVQGLPFVAPDRIGCLGLSMGAHRTWSLNAATDIVKCGAAICWMGDTPTLTQPGNNQTRGQSAFSMLVPGLRIALAYPDVASIACPKPMLFFNGTEDALFPLPGVEASYAKMRAVWELQQAGEKLETKLWPVPHEFNAAMQDEAFAWLDAHLHY